MNTRTWAEGWDIELKFKGLGQRLGLILLGLVMFGSSARVEANQDAQRVLNQEEFKVEYQMEWIFILMSPLNL